MITLPLSYFQRGIYVAGLREEIVATPEQVLDLMEFGECNYLLFLIKIPVPSPTLLFVLFQNFLFNVSLNTF